MDTPTTTKPWYKKSEFMIGAPLVALPLLALFTVIGVYALPYVLMAATNTIYAVVDFAILGGIILVVTDKTLQTTAYYAWKNLTRKIGWFFINQDPIGVIETSIKRMQERLSEMSQSKSDVGGQLKGLQAKIKANADRADMDMKKAQQAEKQGDNNAKTLMALEARQLTLSNQRLTETKNKIELMYRVLDKMVGTVDFNIKKTQSELEIKKEERKAIMSAHSALTKGFSIIGGTSPDAEMFNKAMESIAETANRQLAEIDDIMDLSQGIIKGVDLEKGVIQDDALKMLEDWEKNGSSALLGTDKAVLISQAYDPNQVIDVTPGPKMISQAKTGKFADLLNKK